MNRTSAISTLRALGAMLPTLLAGACGSEPAPADETSTSGEATTTTTTTDPTTGTTTGDEPTTGGSAATTTHCVYVNPFSSQDECREYIGAGWTDEAIAADCADADGTTAAGPCDYPSTLGTCDLPGEPDRFVRLVFPGDDATLCQAQSVGCETFAGGTFTPSDVCVDGGEIDPDASVFEWPTLQCIDPIDGEPQGDGPNGQVCTWTMISGCTEPGRKFADYGACEPVLTQRPYMPVAGPAPPDPPDTRLDDPTYAAEVAWVRQQVEACACVCCHQTSLTPSGAGVWDIEAAGNWIDSFTAYGLAFSGGFIDSSLLGAYPAADNNGFDRATTGLPTTDVARMQAFFAGELAYRGMSPDDFADALPTPKPFYDQQIYEPGPCGPDDGIDEDGTLRWSGGAARYVYVLAAEAANPGVPPNLDVPAGTRWRLDARKGADPVKSKSVRYGELPPGRTQGFPAAGEPAALQSGATYYLYVLADIAAPISRCLFVAP